MKKVTVKPKVKADTSSVYLKSVDTKAAKKLKKLASESGMTMSEYVTVLIEAQ